MRAGALPEERHQGVVAGAAVDGRRQRLLARRHQHAALLRARRRLQGCARGATEGHGAAGARQGRLCTPRRGTATTAARPPHPRRLVPLLPPPPRAVSKKVPIKGVSSFAVAPATDKALLAAFVAEAKGQPAAACIVDATGADAVTLSRRSFYRATGARGPRARGARGRRHAAMRHGLLESAAPLHGPPNPLAPHPATPPSSPRPIPSPPTPTPHAPPPRRHDAVERHLHGVPVHGHLRHRRHQPVLLRGVQGVGKGGEGGRRGGGEEGAVAGAAAAAPRPSHHSHPSLPRAAAAAWTHPPDPTHPPTPGSCTTCPPTRRAPTRRARCRCPRTAPCTTLSGRPPATTSASSPASCPPRWVGDAGRR
jgi:hypothetical protein